MGYPRLLTGGGPIPCIPFPRGEGEEVFRRAAPLSTPPFHPRATAVSPRLDRELVAIRQLR